MNRKLIDKVNCMSYHAFFSHSNIYKNAVEQVAMYIEDTYSLKVWLDKWYLIPSGNWVQELEKSLSNSDSCVVFIGEKNSTGWYKNEVELALNIESKNRDTYRVIPVLLPNADDLEEDKFLSMKTAIDLRNDINDEEELYRLSCGIKGIPPGRYKQNSFNGIDKTKEKLQRLYDYYNDGLIVQEIFMSLQSKILEKEFEL